MKKKNIVHIQEKTISSSSSHHIIYFMCAPDAERSCRCIFKLLPSRSIIFYGMNLIRLYIQKKTNIVRSCEYSKNILFFYCIQYSNLRTRARARNFLPFLFSFLLSSRTFFISHDGWQLCGRERERERRKKNRSKSRSCPV